MGEVFNPKTGRIADVPWVENGVCKNRGEYNCNLGYACDGCPYLRCEYMCEGILDELKEAKEIVGREYEVTDNDELAEVYNILNGVIEKVEE